MSWQNHVRARLRSGEWIAFRDLFDEIERDIPLHVAIRVTHGLGFRNFTNFDARLHLFKNFLSVLRVETSTTERGIRRYHYIETKIRLSDTARKNAALWLYLRNARAEDERAKHG